MIGSLHSYDVCASTHLAQHSRVLYSEGGAVAHTLSHTHHEASQSMAHTTQQTPNACPPHTAAASSAAVLKSQHTSAQQQPNALVQVFDLGSTGQEASSKRVADVQDFTALARSAAGDWEAEPCMAQSSSKMSEQASYRV